MSQRSILRQYQEFAQLTDFLICYFGDDWEGRTEADIVAEAVNESPPEYVVAIHTQLSRFLAAPLSIETKHDIVRATNVYLDTDQDTISWLTRIQQLIEQRHR